MSGWTLVSCGFLFYVLAPATGAYLGHKGYPLWLSMLVAPTLFLTLTLWLGSKPDRTKEND